MLNIYNGTLLFLSTLFLVLYLLLKNPYTYTINKNGEFLYLYKIISDYTNSNWMSRRITLMSSLEIYAKNKNEAQTKLDKQILEIHDKLEEDNIKIEQINLETKEKSGKVQLKLLKENISRHGVDEISYVKDGTYSVKETDTEYLLRFKNSSYKFIPKIAEDIPKVIIIKRDFAYNGNYILFLIPIIISLISIFYIPTNIHFYQPSENMLYFILEFVGIFAIALFSPFILRSFAKILYNFYKSGW